MPRTPKIPINYPGLLDMQIRLICKERGWAEPVPEIRFAKPRMWRFDWAWESYKVALEYEGGIYTGGRHTRMTGFVNDIEKYNTAAELGWKVFRATPDTVTDGTTVNLIERVLRDAGAGQ